MDRLTHGPPRKGRVESRTEEWTEFDGANTYLDPPHGLGPNGCGLPRGRVLQLAAVGWPGRGGARHVPRLPRGPDRLEGPPRRHQSLPLRRRLTARQERSRYPGQVLRLPPRDRGGPSPGAARQDLPRV